MHSSSAYIPSFSLSKFSETITAPYTSLASFSSGLIDANGNLLKPESSIDPYEYFIIKLKKIFDQLPMSYTKARLASYVSTFQMFNEEAEFFGLNSNEFLFFIEGYLESGLLINEDMGTGMVSGGGGPGTLGTPQDVQSTGGVMGYERPLDAPMFTRMPVEMFDVDDAEFKNFKNAKAWKHIPDSETKRYLKRFQQRNPSGKMAIRSNKNIHWLSYPSKSFVEEYDLGFLDILNEGGPIDPQIKQKKSYEIPNDLHEPVNDTLSSIFDIKYTTNTTPVIDRTDSHGAELHARTLLFAKGLHDISKIDDENERNNHFRQFINSVNQIKKKTPSHPDERSKEKLPDAYTFLPDTGTTGIDIKTDRFEGKIPTKLKKDTASSEDIEKEKLKHIDDLNTKWPQGVGVRRNKSGKFFMIPTSSISSHWKPLSGRIIDRNRSQSTTHKNTDTAGSNIEIRSLRSLTRGREDYINIHPEAIEYFKKYIDPKHHSKIDQILKPHI